MKKIINLFKQLLRFGLVGFASFLIDYFIMIFLTEAFGIVYIVSCGISFTISAIVNYLLSMRFVFVSTTKMRKRTEFLIFFIMSILGLVLTECLIALFVERFFIHYKIAKIAVTFIVMAYNFISRKLIFERARKV